MYWHIYFDASELIGRRFPKARILAEADKARATLYVPALALEECVLHRLDEFIDARKGVHVNAKLFEHQLPSTPRSAGDGQRSPTDEQAGPLPPDL
jgi:hypothetical protein